MADELDRSAVCAYVFLALKQRRSGETMMKILSVILRVCVLGLVISLLSSSIALRAAEPTPTPPPSQDTKSEPERKVEKKNYLPFLISISDGTAKSFYQALEQGLQKGENRELIENLGVFQIRNLQGNGDTGAVMAQLFGKRLKWEAVLDQGEKARRLLIFDKGFKRWPGSQPITIVLVDKDFKVLSWLESGGEPMFAIASLQTDKTNLILETQSRYRRERGTWIERFRIVNDKIEKIETFLDRQRPEPAQ